MVTSEVKQLIITTIQTCIDIANKQYSIDITFPTITYTLNGTTAGTANYVTNVINLNPILLMDNLDAYIARTIPHELSHLITNIIDPGAHRSRLGKKRSPHGHTWKTIMLGLGADPSRCHKYNTTNVRTSQQYEYVCQGCGMHLMMGVKRHNKQQKNGDAYSHIGCGEHRLILKPVVAAVLLTDNQATSSKRPTTKSTSVISKKVQAITIFTDMVGSTRGDIIAQFQLVGMSKACASTYYQNIKSGAWE